MDKALKQRMVGASVIIALVVIVLPMLLGGRPENPAQQSQKIELPPRPEDLAFETRRFPVDEPSSEPAPQSSQVETAPAITPINREPAPQQPPAQTAASPVEEESSGDSATAVSEVPVASSAVEAGAPETAAAESEVPPAPQTIASTAQVAASAAQRAKTGRFLVQVASLGSAENAARLMANLRQKDYPVLLDTVESEVGKLNRVRVGPYQTEAEAERAVAGIDEAFSDLNPKLIDLQPVSSAAVPETSASSLGRWVVQAGSFAEAVNADRLVAQLRSDGMNAYQEKVSSGAAPVFRVRIGPYLERDSALKARQALADKRSIEGVVVSAD